MSRSYKKYPYYGDKKSKSQKRIANHKVRLYLKDTKHKIFRSNYKKIYESYNICDFYWMMPWDEYWDDCQKTYKEHPEWYKSPLNKKIEYRKWYRQYKMK